MTHAHDLRLSPYLCVATGDEVSTARVHAISARPNPPAAKIDEACL